MLPIVFWVVATLAVAAALGVAIHRRPVGSILALMILLLLDSVNLFLLGAPLLAVELAVVALGGTAGVWLVLVYRKRERLGVPGRVRFTLAKLVALGIVLWLAFLLGEVLCAAPISKAGRMLEPGGVVMGGVMAIFLLGSAVACTLAAVRCRRGEAETE